MRWRLLWAAALIYLFSCSFPADAERWEMQYFYDKNDSTLSFTDLQFPSARYGIALGAVTENQRLKPVVAITRDGGSNWELLPLKELGASLFFLNEQAGWMVSQKGRLWKTTEAGRNWLQVKLDGVRATPLRIFFLDESRGWLLCDRKKVYSTLDGGQSWQLLPVSQAPEAPEDRSVYTWVAFHNRDVGLLTGWTRPVESRSRVPEWMEPELAPLGFAPTTSIVLHTGDGGKNWSSRVLPKMGQIIRARVLSGGVALLLVQRPDSFSRASEIIGLDLKTFRTSPIYENRNRWLTDIASTGAGGVLAAATDQEGRIPFPTIPSKLRVLQSNDARRWTEMSVDYRAEARRAVLAVLDASHAWLATDTGMILHLVKE